MYNPSRPNLSAGLKRKFQLPKSRPNNDHHSNDQGARAGTSTNSNTNGHSNRPSSNHNSHRGNDNAKAPPPTEEEDDLPEELKGLDRELITKIENEIVDNGESITFMDIAGLNDAKQTIMELVCWPMKRPDLFTGLRRGPNGLLLFGPPGTGITLIGELRYTSIIV
jgi:SpoVK/Ycf46/Vps4 family AAA+-type ATPase